MANNQHFSALLAANPLFSGLDPEMLAAVSNLGVVRRLDPHEVLFSKGDDGDALFAIRRGQISVSVDTSDGKSLTLVVLGSGDVLGEIALLDGRPRTADAKAIEPSELFMVRRHDFLQLLSSNSQVALRVIEMLCARLRASNDRMEEAVLMPLKVRLGRRIRMLADDFGCDLTLSQDQLAVMVGASRESVNRQLQIWRRMSLVSIGRGSLRVLDLDRLARESE
jgi:CRP/FNR family transcriptional regulator, cyclic AMP receptor protein